MDSEMLKKMIKAASRIDDGDEDLNGNYTTVEYGWIDYGDGDDDFDEFADYFEWWRIDVRIDDWWRKWNGWKIDWSNFDDDFGFTCYQCNKPTEFRFWCQPCSSFNFRQNFADWKSGNDAVDKFIQGIQLEATDRYKVLEWIPYEKFKNIKEFGDGGFAKVYSAEWKEGDILYCKKDGRWKRRGNMKVALKVLKNCKEISPQYLEELGKLCIFNSYGSYVTRCYGITKDSNSNFMLVMKFVDHKKMTSLMSWKDKFARLHYTAEGLYRIHRAKLVHRDLHPGNILFSNKSNAVFITDLGLCKPANYNEKDNNKIYGVLPYVAPEVLREKRYTEAADIYSFGIFMSEVLSDITPFEDVDCDNEKDCENLASRIINGERPEIQNLPPLIVELIKLCWDEEPSKRPTADDLRKILKAWKNYNSESELNKKIKKSIINQTHQSASYKSKKICAAQIFRTSKLLDF